MEDDEEGWLLEGVTVHPSLIDALSFPAYWVCMLCENECPCRSIMNACMNRCQTLIFEQLLLGGGFRTNSRTQATAMADNTVDIVAGEHAGMCGEQASAKRSLSSLQRTEPCRQHARCHPDSEPGGTGRRRAGIEY